MTVNLTLSAQCPLCAGAAELFFQIAGKTYRRCGRCSGVFLDQACFVSPEAEKKRYEEHNNDVNDPAYQKFVAPVISNVRERFTPGHSGLDYGAGTGPVIAKLLREEGYSVELYDPYFWNNPGALKRKYDFIVCCEVIEHFKAPAREFKLLRPLLTPGGALLCMTDLYSESIDFRNWYYKNDATHVFFYHQKSLEWIKLGFEFSAVENDGRLTLFLA